MVRQGTIAMICLGLAHGVDMALKSIGVAAAYLAAFSIPAAAHHSHSIYDRTQALVMEAKVKEYIWGNPHVWLYVDIADENGEPEEWILEAADAGGMSRDGWSAESMKPDDMITVTFSPLKDGTGGGLLGAVELADGTYLTTRTLIGPDATRLRPDLTDAEVFGIE